MPWESRHARFPRLFDHNLPAPKPFASSIRHKGMKQYTQANPRRLPMKISSIACGVVLALALAGLARAADVSGKWTASFETQIGTQNYTYEFKVDGQKLTGTAKSMNGETQITEGKVVGDEITFVENLN